MKDEWRDQGPFSVTWYTGSALVAATLQNYKVRNTQLRSAAELFLLPGPVDPDSESVSGLVPAQFIASQIDRYFTCLILSAHSFDILSGTAYFHFPDEIEFQKRCALLPARNKFLFLDASKFRHEGQPGYLVADLLRNCQSVTIYTVMAVPDPTVVAGFDALATSLNMKDVGDDWADVEGQRLRLCIIDRNGSPVLNRPKGTVSASSARVSDRSVSRKTDRLVSKRSA